MKVNYCSPYEVVEKFCFAESFLKINYYPSSLYPLTLKKSKNTEQIVLEDIFIHFNYKVVVLFVNTSHISLPGLVLLS